MEAASPLSGLRCGPLEPSSAERQIGSGASLLWISIKKVVPGDCEGSDQRVDTSGVYVRG